MIINDKDAIGRLNSPLNLINRLKDSSSSRKSAMSLFGVGRQTSSARNVDIKVEDKLIEEIKVSFNPFTTTQKIESFKPHPSSALVIPTSEPQTSLENILDNSDSQIKLGLAHDKALELLHRSVDMLSAKLDDVSASKLPAVISAAAKTVEGIRKERNEAYKNNKDREVHYHFYTPQQNKISDYEVIEVAS